MKRISFFTTSTKNKRKIDILIIDISGKKSELLECVTKKEGEKYFEKDEVCYYVERFGFDNTASLASDGSFDQIESLVNESNEIFEWEEFYTVSKENEDKVDFLAIHPDSKSYELEYGADIKVVGGYTDLGLEIIPTYIVPAAFEALVEGIKLKGYETLEKDT